MNFEEVGWDMHLTALDRSCDIVNALMNLRVRKMSGIS